MPIQADQHPARRSSANMRRAERYLARARALMRLENSSRRETGMDSRALRSALSMRAMTYATLASAYAERAILEHDEAARMRQASKQTRKQTTATRTRGAG